MKIDEDGVIELEDQEKNTLLKYILGSLNQENNGSHETISLDIPFSKNGIREIRNFIENNIEGIPNKNSDEVIKMMFTNLIIASFYYLCEFSRASYTSIHSDDTEIKEASNKSINNIIDKMDVFKKDTQPIQLTKNKNLN